MVREGSIEDRNLRDGNFRSGKEEIKDGSGRRRIMSWNRDRLDERM